MTRLTPVLLLMICGTVLSQGLQPAQPQNPVGFSLDPDSPEVASGLSTAADFYVAGSVQIGPSSGPSLSPAGGAPIYTADLLGLESPTGEYPSWLPPVMMSPLDVDAITNGLDYVPANTINNVPPDREFNFEYSVARPELPLTMDPDRHPVVLNEYQTNGAASDSFSARYVGPAYQGVSLVSDHLGISPIPPAGTPGVESNINAKCDSRWTVYPIFFSLAIDCAADMGVSGADVFVCWGPGTRAEIFIGHWELRVPANFDVDALIMSRDDRGLSPAEYISGDKKRHILFSLTGSSFENPPVTTTVDYTTVTQMPIAPFTTFPSPVGAYNLSGAFTYSWDGSVPTPVTDIFATPAEIGLSLFDDMNAAWGHDPIVAARGTTNGLEDGGTYQYQNATGLLPVTAEQLACLEVNGETGGSDRIVEISDDFGAIITLTTPIDAVGESDFALFARGGDFATLRPRSTLLGDAMLIPGEPDVLLLAPGTLGGGAWGPALFPASPQGTPFTAFIDPILVANLGITRVTLQGIVVFASSSDPTGSGEGLTNAVALAFGVSAF